MAGGEEWVLRVVDAGMLQYESLKSGAIDLADIALLNEYLDAKAVNQQIITDANT